MEKILSNPLTRKLAIALVIKLVGLFVLWWMFFSDTTHQELSPEQVRAALLQPKTK